MQQPQKPFAESGTSPPLRVTVNHVQITPGRTVAIGEGLDECCWGVSFGGRWGPMPVNGETLETGGEVEVSPQELQIPTVGRPRERQSQSRKRRFGYLGGSSWA